MKLLSTFAVLMSVAVTIQSNSFAGSLPYLTGKEAKMDEDQLRHIELEVGKHLDKKDLAGAVTLVLRKGALFISKLTVGKIWRHAIP